MKLIPPMIVAALLAGLAGAQDVRYNFDRQSDFPVSRTYQWVQIPATQKIDRLLAKDIQDTFDAALAKKALTKAESDTADLYIAYQVAVNE